MDQTMQVAVNVEFTEMLRRLREKQCFGAADNTLPAFQAISAEAAMRMYAFGVSEGSETHESAALRKPMNSTPRYREPQPDLYAAWKDWDAKYPEDLKRWYRDKDGRAYWTNVVMCGVTPIPAEVGKYEMRRREELQIEWLQSPSRNSYEEMLLQKLLAAETAMLFPNARVTS